MTRFGLALITVVAAVAFTAEARQSPARADAEKLDYQATERIRTEGMTRSQVMDTVSWLSDV